MTLIDRIEALSDRASQFTELDNKRAESQKLQELLDKALPLNRDLDKEVQQMRLLQDEGIDAARDAISAKATGARLEKLLQRFAEHRSAESLTRGQDWTRLEEGIQTTSQNIASRLKAAWRQFVDTAYSGDSPDDLDGSLAHTDSNIEHLNTYRDSYEELRSLGKTRPNQRADFDRVRELARQLGEINWRFEHDVPDGVSLFLRAVADGGADLDLLTAEVLDWLQQDNKTRRYRVVARTDSK